MVVILNKEKSWATSSNFYLIYCFKDGQSLKRSYLRGGNTIITVDYCLAIIFILVAYQ